MNLHHHHLVPYILHLLIGGYLGLASSSLAARFGARAAERMAGESWLPHCLYCLRPLEWHEAFPFFGWFMRKGAFKFPCACGERRGLWPLPLVELIGLVLGVAAMAMMDWSWPTVSLILGLGLLPAIALIDLQFGIIPDGLNIAVACLGLNWANASGDLGFALISAAALLGLGLFLAFVYSRLRGREMLGLGDVKFFAAAGLWLQPSMAPWFLAIAGLAGVIFGLGWRWAGGGKELPFAPALCLALAICIFAQLTPVP